MSPDKKCVINKHKIEEYFWSGKSITYIDNRKTEETYTQACERIEKMKKTYCFLCQDELAEVERTIPIMRVNGYKFMDFELKLCNECNELSDDFLSYHFSI